MKQGRQIGMPAIFYKPDEPPAGGGTPPPDANVIGEAKRKQAEAEERARAEKKRADDLEARIAAIEGQNDSELTKAVKRAEKAEGERDALKGELAATHRNDHVRQALDRLRGSDKKLQAHDQAAVIAMLGNTGNLDSIDSPEKAVSAVESLTTSHPFLFTSAATGEPGAPPPAPPAFGVPAAPGTPPVNPAQGQLPVQADGTIDRDRALGQGLFTALQSFRSQRGGSPEGSPSPQ